MRSVGHQTPTALARGVKRNRSHPIRVFPPTPVGAAYYSAHGGDIPGGGSPISTWVTRGEGGRHSGTLIRAKRCARKRSTKKGDWAYLYSRSTWPNQGIAETRACRFYTRFLRKPRSECVHNCGRGVSAAERAAITPGAPTHRLPLGGNGWRL